MKTLCELFQDSAEQYSDNVLVHHLERDWTYREIWEMAASLASWLREHGLQDGQRVGLLMPNSAEYVACYFATLLAGGVVVGLNPETTPRELSHTLVHCEPTVVIAAAECERHLLAVAEQLQSVQIVIRLAGQGADRQAEPFALAKHVATFSQILEQPPLDWSPDKADGSQIAQIIYTSGTTGRPKGVTLSHHNLSANCQSILQYLELGPSDSVFVILPFFYSYGNSLLLTHVAAGGRLILASNFIFWQQALDLMEQQQASGFSGVPSTYAMLLHRSNFLKREFPHLRYLTCAGGAMAPQTTKRILQSKPHLRIFPMYGQTEAAARLSTLMPHELDTKLGAIGKGISGVRLSVLNDNGQPTAAGEVGEIYASGDNVMVGYWNDPEATEEVLTPHGLRTGDMARVDEDGYIYIAGRRGDMIKSGAYRISPYEIEEVILEMTGIAEAAVVGEPDEIQGEVVVAYVVLAGRDDALTQRTVIKHCKQALPRHKQVSRVHILEALPKTSSNKIKRAELRQLANAGAGNSPTGKQQTKLS